MPDLETLIASSQYPRVVRTCALMRSITRNTLFVLLGSPVAFVIFGVMTAPFAMAFVDEKIFFRVMACICFALPALVFAGSLLTRFILVVFCFARYTLLHLFGATFIAAGLVTAVDSVPGNLKVIPGFILGTFVLLIGGMIDAQDPTGLNITPDFIRVHSRQRRMKLRKNEKPPSEPGN